MARSIMAVRASGPCAGSVSWHPVAVDPHHGGRGFRASVKVERPIGRTTLTEARVPRRLRPGRRRVRASRSRSAPPGALPCAHGPGRERSHGSERSERLCDRCARERTIRTTTVLRQRAFSGQSRCLASIRSITTSPSRSRRATSNAHAPFPRNVITQVSVSSS